MRPIAFTIIVYILFLLTQPCQDALGAPPSFSGGAAVSQGANDEDCEDGGDGCSPFCICSCRQAPAGYFGFDSGIERKIATVPIRAEDLEYECRVPTATLDSIWQPPKH